MTISDHRQKRVINDACLVPDAAILDAELTVSLPPDLTAATGLDALAHAIESYMSTNATPLTEAMGRSAVRLISASLERAYRDGADVTARRDVLYGAHLSGRALNASSILGHSIAYTIANRVPLPHGTTCAMALPYCVAYGLRDPNVSARLEALATEIQGGSVRRAPDLLDWLTSLNESLEMPRSLREFNIPQASLDEMVRECVESYPRPSNPVPLTHGGLEPLYKQLWSGDLVGYVQDEAREGAPA